MTPASSPTGHAATPRSARDLLREVFGFAGFRPHQEEIVDHLVAGGDAFVLMPTGGGKSLCYQLPALVRPGTGVVVSPLISLMKDQVDALRAAGVSAAACNSSLEPDEARRVLRALHAGELDLVYVAPETLMTHRFLQRLRELIEGARERRAPAGTTPSDSCAGSGGVALFAIDEAHCVSQWGHDFRPEYVQLGRLRELFPGVPIVACTATADPETRDDVRLRLGLADAAVFVTGFDRPNIRYTVVEKREPLHQLVRFLEGHADESGIVYCLSRKRTEDVAEKLRAHGVSAAAYHAGLPADERRRVQDAFARDDVKVVVATVAFGMGIDKSDVRFVVHHDLPKTVESYYQETGRAGRDGLPAEALLLFGLGDAALVRSLIEGGGRTPYGGDEVERDPERVRIELHKLNAMIGYADGLTCRREALLGYFGEPYPAPCGNCDICLDPPETFDATEQARMALSCIYRLWEHDGFGYGVGYVIDVLRGSDNEKVISRGHDALSTWGIGGDLSRDHWQSLIRQLIHRGYLAQDIARFSALRLTAAARPLLRGEETLVLAVPRTRVPGKKQRLRAERAGRAAELAGLPVDEALFEALRGLRKRLADEQNVPAYVVFSDATLAEMAARRPGTYAELLAVNGVGRAKLERYADAFLAVIAEHVSGRSAPGALF
ncbi:MAG: RecQ family ATP-dependent DNA helicase [Actinobacteria bacterium]|nr:RecQ family ATP-dependent DNA helicase [Actinomycetota bacterium]